MVFEIEARGDCVAVIKVFGPLVHTDSLAALERIIFRLQQQGKRLVILDCAKVSRVSISGITSLVEMVSRPHAIPAALCSLSNSIIRRLVAENLEHSIQHFDDVQHVLKVPQFRACQLADLRVLVLCAGRGARLAPLSDEVPKPMLDMLGKPVLARILDHLESFGIREVFLNPGHLGPQIHSYFAKNSRPFQSVFYLNEGNYWNGIWKPGPLGSASTMRKLQADHNAFNSDFLVVCGDALIDIDLADMLAQHQRTDADVTIATLSVPSDKTHKYGMIDVDVNGRILRFKEKPARGTIDSTLANTGIYIFNPRVLSLMQEMHDQDIGADLLPRIMDAGGAMHAYSQGFSWTDIGCAKDYFAAAVSVLGGHVPNATPEGVLRNPLQWVDKDAIISRRAKISGPCYIGPGAKVSAGAKIEGPAVIGRGAIISGRSIVRNSMVMPNTHVQKGAIIDGQITHPNWSVAIQFADGSPQNMDPLEYVGEARTTAPDAGRDQTQAAKAQ